PEADGARIRARHGIGPVPVVVCVSRLVPRKGQDVLIEALPAVRRAAPGTVLLLVGGGPYAKALRRKASALGVGGAVVLAGPVPDADLPAHFAAGDVFAMPCRTRRGGLDVEGLGVVYLEAAATGLPVIAGDSGGATDTVRHGETGYVVNGRDTAAVARRLSELLTDPPLVRKMGAAGRQWMRAAWTWPDRADRLRRLLA
ncbi:MAG TPA: glycosyltransferase family 4 protein, partial [Stackebrandtia sp.]|uniref:glycosyltransferase family 4 protein n=1 Tax=Stackebrandtia sp. TaxID=2023065 RepID=UPI002D27B937